MTGTQPPAAGGHALEALARRAGLDEAARRRLAGAHRVAVPAGAVLFRPGDRCESYLVVLSGTARVQHVSEGGREIVLYRIGAGETCILTTACLMAGEAYSAEGIAETAVEAVAVPQAAFHDLIAASASFRRFVFASYGARLADLMLLVEEVAFGRIDVRLARFLAAHGGAAGTVAMTHQDLATELGTAREVVSRQLKEFERRGWVALHRGRIDLTDGTALRSLGAAEGGRPPVV